MSENCPNCKSKLFAEHSFCPNCGYDMRSTSKVTEDLKEPESPSIEVNNQMGQTPKGDFKTPLIIAISFTVISIFIWSYVYTNNKFNFDVFLGRLINHSVWILLAPYLISLAFNKAKRSKIYMNLVLVSVVLGLIFLLLGYSQLKATQDPFMIKLEIRKPCIDNVIEQLAEYDVSYEIKTLRATKYCDCILEKFSDENIIMVRNGEKKFWDTITSEYSEENKECVLVSLEND